MTTATTPKPRIAPGLHPSILTRLLEEGYGSGAWHGPDLAAAVAEVTPTMAFRRPAPGRHNIAEIVLHHLWCIRSVIGQLTGEPGAPFPVEGEDWFELDGSRGPTWPELHAMLADRQQALSRVVSDSASGRIASPLDESGRFDLVLGIACHAIYHAGQIQLIKRLLAP